MAVRISRGVVQEAAVGHRLIAVESVLLLVDVVVVVVEGEPWHIANDIERSDRPRVCGGMNIAAAAHAPMVRWQRLCVVDGRSAHEIFEQKLVLVG